MLRSGLAHCLGLKCSDQGERFVPKHLDLDISTPIAQNLARTTTQQQHNTITSSYNTLSKMNDPLTKFIELHDKTGWTHRDYILLWWFCHHPEEFPISSTHRELYDLRRVIKPIYTALNIDGLEYAVSQFARIEQRTSD